MVTVAGGHHRGWFPENEEMHWRDQLERWNLLSEVALRNHYKFLYVTISLSTPICFHFLSLYMRDSFVMFYIIVTVLFGT